jgi:hypothetical protein
MEAPDPSDGPGASSVPEAYLINVIVRVSVNLPVSSL